MDVQVKWKFFYCHKDYHSNTENNIDDFEELEKTSNNGEGFIEYKCFYWKVSKRRAIWVALIVAPEVKYRYENVE